MIFIAIIKFYYRHVIFKTQNTIDLFKTRLKNTWKMNLYNPVDIIQMRVVDLEVPTRPRWLLPFSPFPWLQHFHLQFISLNSIHLFLFVPSVLQLQPSSPGNSPLSPSPHAPLNPPRFLIPIAKTELFSLPMNHPTPFSEFVTRYCFQFTFHKTFVLFSCAFFVVYFMSLTSFTLLKRKS